MQQERRQKILEWKQNKEKELIEKKQILLEEKKIQKQKEKEIYYINKIKTQYILDDYHKKKEQEKEKQRLIEEEKIKSAQNINKFDIDRIKDKEDALLQKKLEAKQNKASVKMNQEIKYQNYKIKEKEKLKYVPSKLKESTTQSKNRKREKFDANKEQKKDAYTMANNVLGRTARAIPAWRQGL